MSKAPKVSIKSRRFEGIRVEVDTTVSFDKVLKRLRRMTGGATVAELVTLARDVGNEAEYLRQVEQRFSGQSGFIFLVRQ
jgi:hypothetical protein